MNLRDYQVDACKAAIECWDNGTRRVLLTLATGLGKTVIFSTLAKLHHEAGRGRVLVIAPSIELVGQAAAKLERVSGERVAIEQAGNWSNESRDARSPYIAACKATLTADMRDGRKRFERFADVGLVIVDEAHYSATAAYREILDHFDCHVLGVTATPNRHDGVALEGVYEAAPYTMGIREAIDAGWLVAPKTRCLQLQTLDLSSVRTNRGDFVQAALGEAMEGDDVVFEVAAATAQEAQGEKSIVFCASVDQAMKTAQVLATHHNLRADWVCGDARRCPPSKREAILDSFTRDPDGVQVVCNVGVLTTGFDFPGLKHIVMARPTKSTPLFTQIFGRGTRALDGVVDFEGSTPESRKAAIAASGKPSWRFTDLRDVSLAHKLATPVDVLGGDKSVDVLDRVRAKLAEADDARDFDEVVDEVEAEIRDEAAAERARLAAIAARAEFHAVEVDPFVDAFRATHTPSDEPKKRGPRMPYGKYRGLLIAEVPRSYLSWVRRNHNPRGWLGEAINKQLGVKEAVA